ncbi:extracellular solute-binding protein, partial [Streptomyces ipomoeae]
MSTAVGSPGGTSADPSQAIPVYTPGPVTVRPCGSGMSGPMAMMYREDLFKKYKLKVPTTWAEFKKQAEKLHKADPNVYLTDFGSDETAAGWRQGLMWQAGSRPYTYSASKLPNIGVKLNDDGAKKVYDYWGDLVKNRLVDTQSYATTDFYNGLSSGKYATYIAAGWGPGYRDLFAVLR